MYVSLDRIIVSVHRDFGIEVYEDDLIEWIGEANAFLSTYTSFEEVVSFLSVENYQTSFPKNLQTILQISKDNGEETKYCLDNVKEIVKEASPCDCPETDCSGDIITCEDSLTVKNYFDVSWKYNYWLSQPMYKQRFTPIRLTSHTFFGGLVSREMDQTPYNTCVDEYEIVGSNPQVLRFSFKTGNIALSYLKNRVDPKTGYPLIKDDPNHIAAITNYIGWKNARRNWYRGEQGWLEISRDAEIHWLKYLGIAKSRDKMPQSLDEYQNILEESFNIFPDFNRHYNNYGNF